ncbi:hypothetical protein PV646_35615 [Streptomyces sp. ID05-26A]|nr:hypothetical protein [Streptomyces sp. ID05-26A]
MFLAVLGILLGCLGILATFAVYFLQKRDLRVREHRRKEKERESELEAAKKRIAELEGPNDSERTP